MTTPNHPPRTGYSPDALAVALLQHTTDPETAAAIRKLQQANAADWIGSVAAAEIAVHSPITPPEPFTDTVLVQPETMPVPTVQAIGFSAIQAA